MKKGELRARAIEHAKDYEDAVDIYRKDYEAAKRRAHDRMVELARKGELQSVEDIRNIAAQNLSGLSDALFAMDKGAALRQAQELVVLFENWEPEEPEVDEFEIELARELVVDAERTRGILVAELRGMLSSDEHREHFDEARECLQLLGVELQEAIAAGDDVRAEEAIAQRADIKAAYKIDEELEGWLEWMRDTRDVRPDWMQALRNAGIQAKQEDPGVDLQAILLREADSLRKGKHTRREAQGWT